jgi:putative endopeptidase
MFVTEPTKEQALKKLAKFLVCIGYPDKWRDYSRFDCKNGDSLYDIKKKSNKWDLEVNFFDKINSLLDRREWGSRLPQNVNATFFASQNKVIFLAGILQPPFYCKTLNDVVANIDITSEIKNLETLIFEVSRLGHSSIDQTSESGMNINAPDLADPLTAINFGGIGAVIAHEITHGYDDKGHKFDGNGNLVDWWTTEDEKNYKIKQDLMMEQAKQYIYYNYETKKQYVMNPSLTMGENIADLGGISLAKKAFMIRLTKSLSNHNVPADLAKLIIREHLRILFKAWANIWKQNQKTDARINALTVDPHLFGYKN